MVAKLLDAVAVDTNGTGVKADGGGKTLAVWATSFGSGTVTIQGSPDGGVTWITLTIAGNPAAFTANSIRYIDRLGQGMQIRAILAGSTGASNVNAAIFD